MDTCAVTKTEQQSQASSSGTEQHGTDMATVEIAPVDSGHTGYGAELSQPRLALAGQVANEYAAAAVFVDYTSRKSLNTLRAQQSDLTTFAEFLMDAGAVNANFDAALLQEQPHVWRGVTWGLVDAFV